MNRTDLQSLADIRIKEAIALAGLPTPLPDGAYYLAGYAVECALKACIASTYNQHDWPEKKFVDKCHTHSLLELVQLAGLRAAFDSDTNANNALAQNWDVAKDWNEQSRYNRHSLQKAQKLISAIADLSNGVLPWIKVHW